MDFDSLEYWRARHEKYQADARGVGNLAFSKEENEKIYLAMDAYVAEIVSALKLPEQAKVLDLGCGIGMISDAFIRAGCQYTGIDISDKAVEIASEKHPAGKFSVGNIADLPFEQPFDLIIERTVFIHLVEDEYWNSVLREVKRLLAPNGIFVMMDLLPLTPDQVPKTSAHVNFRLRSAYESAFRSVGLGFNMPLRDLLGRQIKLSPLTHFVSHQTLAA